MAVASDQMMSCIPPTACIQHIATSMPGQCQSIQCTDQLHDVEHVTTDTGATGDVIQLHLEMLQPVLQHAEAKGYYAACPKETLVWHA